MLQEARPVRVVFLAEAGLGLLILRLRSLRNLSNSEKQAVAGYCNREQTNSSLKLWSFLVGPIGRV